MANDSINPQRRALLHGGGVGALGKAVTGLGLGRGAVKQPLSLSFAESRDVAAVLRCCNAPATAAAFSRRRWPAASGQ